VVDLLLINGGFVMKINKRMTIDNVWTRQKRVINIVSKKYNQWATRLKYVQDEIQKEQAASSKSLEELIAQAIEKKKEMQKMEKKGAAAKVATKKKKPSKKQRKKAKKKK